MNTVTHSRTPLILAVLFGGGLFAGAALAQQDGDHAAHHPAETGASDATPDAAPAARIGVMQERMQRMRQMRDPAERMRLMEAQMADMESMMKTMPADCPMMSDGRSMGPGMMKGGMMKGGMMGGAPEAMQQRMEAMEKRIEAIEQRIQSHSSAR